MRRTLIQKMQKMVPTGSVSTVDFFYAKTANANMSLKDRFSLVKCECGAKILLLPDLREMSRAIEAHVAEHRKQKGHVRIAESNHVNQLLVQLSLMKASERTSV